MESNDFLESLHIPKDENDIQKQLNTLGKFCANLTERTGLARRVRVQGSSLESTIAK